jgi:hypothetical protein
MTYWNHACTNLIGIPVNNRGLSDIRTPLSCSYNQRPSHRIPRIRRSNSDYLLLQPLPTIFACQHRR